MRMGYHLLTRNLFCCLICFGLLSLKGVAFAQVYKSYDANGNVIFSDKPTQRSQEVDVTKPNVSDSFDIPPPSAESSPETKPETKPESDPVTQPSEDYDPADTNQDGRVSRREKEEEREERHKKNREEREAAEGDKE
jgi:hypothetical protein